MTVSENNIYGFITAWKDVIQFLKQKKIENLKKMNSLYQYTLRGVFGYLYKRVEKSSSNVTYKLKMKKIIINNLKRHINKNFIVDVNELLNRVKINAHEERKSKIIFFSLGIFLLASTGIIISIIR